MEELYLINKEELQKMSKIVRKQNNIEDDQVNLDKILSLTQPLKQNIFKQIINKRVINSEITMTLTTLRPYLFSRVEGPVSTLFKDSAGEKRTIWGIDKLSFEQPITEVNEGAFKENNIINLELNTTINSLLSELFKDSKILKNITFSNPEFITTIGSSCFEGCESLENINSLKFSSLATIETNAFKNCRNFRSLKNEIFGTLTYIGDSAFENCTSLQYIPTLSKVTHIGEKAFYNCSNLSSENDSDALASGASCSLEYIKFIGIEAFANVKLIESKEGHTSHFYLHNSPSGQTQPFLEIKDRAFQNFSCDYFDFNVKYIKSLGADVFIGADIKTLVLPHTWSNSNAVANWIKLDLSTPFSSPFLAAREWDVSQVYIDISSWTFEYASNSSTETIIKKYSFYGFAPVSETTPLNEIPYTLESTDDEYSDYAIKEMQEESFTFSTFDACYFPSVKKIGKQAFANAYINDYCAEEGYVNVSLGSLEHPVENIAEDAFQDVRFYQDENGNLLNDQITFIIYYDNRDYSETGYPETYQYGPDGLPLGHDCYWGLSGLHDKLTVEFREAFPQ